MPSGAKELYLALRRDGAYGAPLSGRELDILALTARDFSNNDIARELGLSVETVKLHLKHIFKKMGVKGRMEAVLAALARGILAMWVEPVTGAVDVRLCTR